KFGGLTDVTTDVVAHAANNYWYSNSGFPFEVQSDAHVLIEGNYFQDTTEPGLRRAATVGHVHELQADGYISRRDGYIHISFV
ncbi:Pectate lyase, partial [Globisporangium polare]